MATTGFLITVPARFTISKASYSYPYLSIPFKPVKSQLEFLLLLFFFFNLSPYCIFYEQERNPFESFCDGCSARRDNPVVLEEERGEEEEVIQGIVNWDMSENEAVGEESDGVVGAVGDAGEDDGYVEPPEEAKVFVGNLHYDVDSEKLAQIF